MKSISDPVEKIINNYKEEVMMWCSNQVYKKLCQGDKEHILVKIKEQVDLSKIEAACDGYHHKKGVGRSVTHSIGQLLRVLLVRYLTQSSLRQTERKIRYDMMCKWFAGYSLFAKGPDHSRIHEFEKWLMKNHPRLLFDEILRQIDEIMPEERERVQIGDTFALIANAQEEGVTAKLRHGCEIILRILKKENKVGYEWLISQLDKEKIWSRQKESYQLSKEERQTKRQQVGQGTLALISLLSQIKKGEKIEEWIELLERVLKEAFQIIGEKGERTIVKCEYKKRDKGDYGIYSMTDPEASRRNHGKNKQDFGYNVSVATTTDFVREIEARPGSEHDSVAIVDLLSAQKEHHDLLPAKFVYDQAAGTGKVAADVDAATQGETQLVVDPVIYANRKKTYGPQDFGLTPDEETAICPHQQESYTWYRDSSDSGRSYIFSPTVCRDCPLRVQCRPTPQNQTKREVFFSDHRLYFQRLLTYTQTPTYAQEMALRPQVERIIAALTRFNGARHALFRGQAKVDFQMKMCATAFNLKQWLTSKRLKQRPPPSKMVSNEKISLTTILA